MNRPGVDHFPSGLLVYFPSGASTGAGSIALLAFEPSNLSVLRVFGGLEPPPIGTPEPATLKLLALGGIVIGMRGSRSSRIQQLRRRNSCSAFRSYPWLRVFHRQQGIRRFLKVVLEIRPGPGRVTSSGLGIVGGSVDLLRGNWWDGRRSQS